MLPVNPLDDQIKVLLTDDTPWALIKRSVSDVRRTRDGLAEQITQVLIGEAVRVLEDRGYWSLVRAERDGYIGWTRSAALHSCDRKNCARLSKIGQCAGAGRPCSRVRSTGQRSATSGGVAVCSGAASDRNAARLGGASSAG